MSPRLRDDSNRCPWWYQPAKSGDRTASHGVPGRKRRENFTQEEVAQMVGVNHSRVSQVQDENASIIRTNNACIPEVPVILDQRFRLSLLAL
jgi:hydrogenase maturation factor HypE